MTTMTTPTGLLRIADLTPADLTRVLDLAKAMKAEPRGWHDAFAGARAVYTDVRVSMGDEAGDRLHDLREYQVDTELMALAAPDAIFLHCLPAHRGREVAAEVIDGPQSAVWQQAANRLPTEQAALYALVTGDWGV
jgi:ornithine carbamoyltransferase